MGGKRYVGGLLAGLLLGFIVVIAGSSGFVSGTFGNASLSPASQSDHQGQTTITTFATSTAAFVAASTTTQSRNLSGSASAVSTTTNFLASAKSTTIGSSTTSNPITLNPYGTVNGGSSSNPAPSSSLYGIVHQPLFSDFIILVPLFVAFLIGTLIYRLSVRTQDKE